ncbi:MAG: hypothetical protein ACRC7V_03035 [Lachnospiraceae bacterium]
MEQKNTSNLLNILKTSSKSNLTSFEEKHLKNIETNFVSYIDTLIDQKNLKRKDIFQKADLPQKYGYKLLTGECHTKDRDKLLRIFLAMKLTLKETQRALALYGMPALYPKYKRDALLIIAINQGISSVDTINEWLLDENEPILSPSSL